MAYIIKGRYDFFVNGVSARSVGLVVDNLDPPPFAEQRISVYPVGSDADLVAPDETYNDIIIRINARILKKPFDMDNSALYAFLNGARTLKLSTIPDKHFCVNAVQGITPTAVYNGNQHSYEISFRCAPFKYHDSNDEITFSGSTITNPGTRYARPLWHVTGAATTTLTVNGETFTVTGSSGTEYYIDSEHLLAYLPNGTNILPITYGNFPFLQSGINSVSISAGTLKYKMNARDY